MRGQAARYAAWLDLAGELLNRPPHTWRLENAHLASTLNETIGAPATSWNAVDARWVDTLAGCWPEDFLPAEPPGGRAPSPAWQPLLAWYAHTHGNAPQTLGRVPGSIAGRRMLIEWVSFARPLHITHQLAIPVWVDATTHYAFVLARPDRDFSDADLELATRIQPILSALYRQHTVLQHDVTPPAVLDVELGLTTREYTVLGLLAQGLTAEAIARRLYISPRTVHKHLERLYRKMGVQDRLMAVARAKDASLNIGQQVGPVCPPPETTFPAGAQLGSGGRVPQPRARPSPPGSAPSSR